jgi:hypothetical protein
LAWFVREFKGSAWLDKEGFPASWRHFRIGVDHLLRSRARGNIDLCNAMRVARSRQQDYDDWMTKQKRAADWD